MIVPHLIWLCLILMLAACAVTDITPWEFEVDGTIIEIWLPPGDSRLPTRCQDIHSNGCDIFHNGFHYLYLYTDQPEVLAHEERHVREGNYHGPWQKDKRGFWCTFDNKYAKNICPGAPRK